MVGDGPPLSWSVMSDNSAAPGPNPIEERDLVARIDSYLDRYDTTVDETNPAYLTPGSLLAALRHALATGTESVPAEDVITALRLVPAARTKLDDTERQLIEAALDRGVTWHDLGSALGGRSAQAIQQRYRRRLGGKNTWPTRRAEHRPHRSERD